MSTKPDQLKCGSDASYCKFGIDRLTKLLEAFETQIDGVIESQDVEYVHRMRVSSRRIRATMPLFQTCLPQKKFKRWLKEIKRVTQFLGEARDLDIQIAFIKQYQSKNKDSPKNPSIELLLKSKRTRRTRIQPSVVKGLEELRDSDILTKMREFHNRTAINLQKALFKLSSVREKAYWAISRRLDDFLAMKEYVYQENQALKLHEMRIRAKHLRYTMETYSSIYKNALTSEIETIKGFQDTLGEMHDCDVWIEFFPKFTTNAKTKNKPAKRRGISFSKFSEYVKQQRKDHYASFIALWESCKKRGFFEKLKETVKSGFPKVEDKIGELQKTSQPEVAVLSDIHANLYALQAVIGDAQKRGIHFFLNAGDLIGFGPCPNEVIELLHANNVISVIGNFDLEVLSKDEKGKKEAGMALQYARKQLSCSCRNYLLSLPHKLKLDVAGKTVFMTHGTPESIDDHLYNDTPEERLLEIAYDTEADVIITGHSHEPYTREVDGKVFLNPGSVGRPSDGNPQASYAISRFNPFKTEMIRVDYDVPAAADALRRKGLPESFSQMLLRGVAGKAAS